MEVSEKYESFFLKSPEERYLELMNTKTKIYSKSASIYDCFLFRIDTRRIKSNSETKFLKNSIYFLIRINVCGFPINYF